jgi:PAS domain S-box-containing protein
MPHRLAEKLGKSIKSHHWGKIMRNTPIKSIEPNFMTLLNFIVDPAVIVDEKANLLVVNDAFMDLTGLSKNELIGTSFLNFKFLSAESKAALLKNLKKRMGGSAVEPYEIQFTDGTGKARCVEVKAKKINYAGQNADLVIFRDITRRKENARRLKEYSEKMEALVNEKVKEIKEHKEKFETIFNSSPDAITFCDLNGIIIECNEATLNLYGFSSREELCGKNAFELIALKEHQKAAMLMETLFKKGSIKTLELISLTKDCKEFPAEASASVIKDAAGNPVGLVAITKDISKRKKMEDELKQERDMLEAVTDNIGAGLIIISKDYHALWANNFIKRYKGNVAGKLCYATLNTLDAPCPDCGVKKIFEDSVAIDAHEYCSTTIDGKPYWVEIIATPIKDKEGNVIAALELAVDITEKKIMQSKLAEYSQKLKKKVEKRTEQLKQTQAKLVRSERLAAIGELAAMVGHDLRNPLTGIMGAAYYLQTKHGADIGTKGKEMLKSIENAINYSNKIVNDLLEYSIDLKLDLAEVTPKALLKNALPFLEVPDRTQIVNATQDYPSVKADTEKMHRVFVNIIQNAFDAMPKGGTLTIKSREVKGKLEISFKDTGAGMSEENLSKLKREVPLFTTKAKGMGFGLPICRRIVEAHGGKLSVESKFEKGTKVTVTIPVNPKPVNKSEEKWIFSESMLSTITTQETP